MNARLAIPVVTVAALAAGLAPARAATPAPAGLPDMSAMTLSPADLPRGASVLADGYTHAKHLAGDYQRVIMFRRGAQRRAGMVVLISNMRLFGNADQAQLFFHTAKSTFTHRKTRRRLARIFAAGAGVSMKHVRAGKPRRFHLADGAVALSLTLVGPRHRATSVFSFLVLDRMVEELDVVGATDNRHVMRRTRALQRRTSAAIRRGLSPVSTSPPTITGTSVLHAEPGTWSDATAPTGFTYQWQRCDASGAACVAIPGAIAPDYAVTPQDAGSTLRVVVTARNHVGSTSATSSAVPG